MARTKAAVRSAIARAVGQKSPPKREAKREPKPLPKPEIKQEPVWIDAEDVKPQVRSRVDVEVELPDRDLKTEQLADFCRRSFDLRVFKSALRKFGRCSSITCDPLMQRPHLRLSGNCCNSCRKVRSYLFSMFILTQTPDDLRKHVYGALDHEFVEELIEGVRSVFSLDERLIAAVERSPLCTGFYFNLTQEDLVETTKKCDVHVPKPEEKSHRFVFCVRHFEIVTLLHRARHMLFNAFKNFEHWASGCWTRLVKRRPTALRTWAEERMEVEQKGDFKYPPGFQTLHSQCMNFVMSFETIAAVQHSRFRDLAAFALERDRWRAFVDARKSRAVRRLAAQLAPKLLKEVDEKADRLFAVQFSRLTTLC
ncbi:hypothetical protein M3Y99_01815400 [Aphelenchoides fujianensis]|nr:hypothetical protein M3Y99_01815400 [Aphelenchoides fujianensis]